ncbi:stalk domain-containing protein [Xylanibacillus composti]|uniref:Copper amine oxidase-like N-terminal domain-containing protein n=1 Tax=Xylanibacillus composti TaxID=1572762 RepID=A0A8J4M3F9_9BACL|nr:stalk domain-containing protein [Xylanibacillus composti]GIQ70789.1 hypothetical protein XYCOK13_36130 [Xylanibacillus composti]
MTAVLPQGNRGLLLRVMIVLALAMGSLGIAGTGKAQAERDSVIEFPDPVLDWLVRQEIGLAEGPIRLSDAEQVEELDVRYEKLEAFREQNGYWFAYLEDLTGMEQLVNLKSLILWDSHSVESLDIIASLPKLEKIVIWEGRPIDLELFSGLHSLRELVVTNVISEDLEPLRSLANLEVLNLISNTLQDVSALESLPQLRELSLYSWPENSVDLQVLDKLTKLERLSIHQQGLRQLDFLRHMPELRELHISNNPIISYEPVKQLSRLESLSVSHVDDLSFVAPLSHLQQLSVEQGQISDLRPLENLTQLRRLWLAGNEIRDVTPLSKLTNLEYLTLQSNAVEDISSLRTLANLEEFHAGGNPIRDVHAIGEMAKLRVLNLDDTSITSLRGLERLSELREVTLRSTVVPVDGEPAIKAWKDRILTAGGTFYYEAYNPIPDILLYVNRNRVFAGGEYGEIREAPFIHESRTLAPIRFVSEYLGADVKWDQTSRTITVDGLDQRIVLTVGSREVTVGKERVTLDVSPQVRNGTAFVPLRFLSEQMGLKVDYYHWYGNIGLTAGAGEDQ